MSVCDVIKDRNRSYEQISKDDLVRLGKLAIQDQEGLFARSPELGMIYASRLLGIMLCQGAALHYAQTQRRQENRELRGIKDFDLWCFYRKDPRRNVPYRRRGIADFGDPKFGQTADSPHFMGRRVDIMMRTILVEDDMDYSAAIRTYLQAGRSGSARCLAERPVVTLFPLAECGSIIWLPDTHMER